MVHRLGHAHDLISDLPNGGIDLPIGINHFADEDASDGPVFPPYRLAEGCPVPDVQSPREGHRLVSGSGH